MEWYWRSGFSPLPSGAEKACVPALVTRESSWKGLATKKTRREKKVPAAHQHGNHVGHQLAVLAAVLPNHQGAVNRKQPRPEQQRPFLPSPQRRNLVIREQITVGMFGHIGVVEVVREDHVFQGHHRQRNHQEESQGGTLGAAGNARAAELAPHGSGDKGIGRERQGGNQTDTTDLVHKYSLRGCSSRDGSRGRPEVLCPEAYFAPLSAATGPFMPAPFEPGAA